MQKYPFQDMTLSMEERVADLLRRLTLEEKIYMLSTHQMPVERLGIGEWYIGQEIARGYVGREPETVSTVFPQPIGLASTFDPALMLQLGEIAGKEARYYQRKDPKSHLMVWGPTVDPERDPRWGRTEEGYGEDPFLIGEMTTAYTQGLAGEDPVYRRTIPTLKHFCANNNEKNRGSSSSNITPRTLHEYYYRAFEASIVRGGADSMMTAYNELAGVPACMNPDLQHVVKDQWKLGFVVTDGTDFSQNVLAHRSHATHGEALAACLKSGCDIMTDGEEMVAVAARDALKRGLITEAEIDRAVGNALLGRFRLGEFDGDACPYCTEPAETDTPVHRAVNQCAAMEQMCLLHNEGLLPLSLKKGQKVAVIGPLGDENYRDWYTGASSYHVSVLDGLRQLLGEDQVLWDDGYDVVGLRSVQNGAYASVEADGTVRFSAETPGEKERFQYHDWDFGSVNLRSCWNGRYVTEDGVYRASSETPYEWFIREWLRPEPYGKHMLFHSWHDQPMHVTMQEDGTLRAVSGGRPSPERLFEVEVLEDGISRAAKLAAEADVVVLCLGNHPMQVARECYDRPNLELPAHEKALLRAVQQANPQTVLVVVSSYPYALEEAQQLVPSILYTTHAGPELGNAVAETLLGGNNPAARCPITWYRTAQDLPDIMEYDIIEAERTYLYDTVKPLYPFGHGLSYSSFAYRDFTAEVKKEGLLFHLTVENTSERDGDEVVQLYTRALHSRMKRPRRQLCGFQRVPVPAGDSVPVTIFVPWYALECYDVTQEKMLVEQGDYWFGAGASSADIRLELEQMVPGEEIPLRDLSLPTLVKNYDAKSGMEMHLWFSKKQNDWYGCTNDWGGTFCFAKAAFQGYTKGELWAAAPCLEATVQIYAGETLLGETKIRPSGCPDDFCRYTLDLKPYTGTADLRLVVQGMASLYRIQLG
ncbi:glycoside hydrolase family 3 C-terminal domain-containing protein [uncultured Ruminococcus sp.]|uniref:glycoside hydrolase family 3 C-terminal domain-containing protein n=1 Tax=uncultured Ruminococcus sp. TaxID=165186 RepID=UPI0025E93FF9|nr:glycoside hydrolase family 3 C-terminal domain-containing protein [uncultured Ruminococcus sp.]